MSVSGTESSAATRPRVAVGSLGGTITMTEDAPGSGAKPSLGADDLVAAVPDLTRVAEIEARTLARRPGASLTPADVLSAVDWAKAAVDDGAAGVVITQGTDTLEETAYLADLFWDRSAPLVFSGAMRSPGQVGADGGANLLAAVSAAASLELRELGVVLVMNEEIHEARRVRKSHTMAMQAFTSADGGPLGRLIEGQVRLHHHSTRAAPALTQPVTGHDSRVALLEMALGDDGALIGTCLQAGYAGIVVSAFGVGHVSASAAGAIEAALAQVPVVVASRTGAGSTLQSTYGFPGSERDLLQRGAVLSGGLDARKSRLLLWALLGAGAGREQIRTEFARLGAL